MAAGMITLATATQENRAVINDKNGILISDSANAFYWGLKTIYRSRLQYDFETIQREASKYTWENIAERYLEPLVKKAICDDNSR